MAWLAKMQAEKEAKRRSEEEAEARRQRYRQKLRETLLQRAGARAGDQGFQATTKAAESSYIKKEKEEELTPEEQARRDKENYDKVVATRRAFKAKQKRHMAELKARRREKEEEEQRQAEEEDARKRKVREQAERRMAEERERRRMASPFPDADPAEVDAPPPAPGAAGSGARAARAVAGQQPAAAAAAAEGGDPAAQQRALAAQRRARREAKERMERELARIAEERRRKAEVEAALARRLERRAQLLREKTLQRIAEGKEKAPEADDGAERLGEEGGEEEAAAAAAAADADGDGAGGAGAGAGAADKPRGRRRGDRSGSEEAGEPSAAAEKKQLTTEQQKAMVERLTSKKEKAPPVDEGYRDYADWRSKNGLEEGQRVFCMTGWYPCVKDALLERGWFFNADRESRFFDLKWTLRSSDVKKENLEPRQLTNHFLKNIAITTKVGLLRNLRGLSNFVPVDPDDIFPRAYDLSQELDFHAFLDDYRAVAAEALLKGLLRRAGGEPALRALRARMPGGGASIDIESSDEGSIVLDDSESDEDDHSNKNKNSKENRAGKEEPAAEEDAAGAGGAEEGNAEAGAGAAAGEGGGEGGGQEAEPPAPPKDGEEGAAKGPLDFCDLDLCDRIEVNSAVLEAALSVCRKRVQIIDDSYIDAPGRELEPLVTDLQWELLCQGAAGGLGRAVALPDQAPEGLTAFLRAPDADKVDPNDWKAKKRHQRRKRARRAERDAARHDAAAAPRPLGEEGLRAVVAALEALKAACPQFAVNGLMEPQNVWIVKPAAKSRGRGIQTFNEIDKLLEYVEARDRNTACQWVVQKYMENPLVVAKRKFDIRQWVLVTDWNPLTIWFNQECYLRFGVEEYTLDEENMDNKFVHLVNNSIGKYSKQYNQKLVAEDGKEIESCMWSSEDFKEYCKTVAGEDHFTNKIQPRMKEIAIWSLMAVQDLIEHRKNSWELYGYDFMIDDQFQTYLIEINSSPACDYSTHVTERFVKRALVDLLKVTLDTREWERRGGKPGPPPETGGWERVHRAAAVHPQASLGNDLFLAGTRIERKKKKL